MKKNVLITGGTRGIGLGIALELAKKGHNLALNGVRDREQIKTVVQELNDLGSRVVYCPGDISNAQDRNSIVNAALDHLGYLNVLVNNAGVAPSERNDLLMTTEDSYDRVMATNLKGPFFLTQLVVNQMIANMDPNQDFNGCIVNISSISASVASTHRSEYCLSKAGMSMMSQLFAVRLCEHGIPVFEVRPGIIKTDMTAGVLERYQQLNEEHATMRSDFGSPEDVGKVVSALVEGSLPYATGNVIMVDGGLTIPRL